MEYKYGDIIEYIDETYDENFNNARKWAISHNATFDELVDRRETRDVEETYIENVPVEREIVVPAQTHEELIPAEYDGDGKEISTEHTETIIDVPEHTENVTEYEEQEKKRIVKKLFRFFEIKEIPPYVPTHDDIIKQREEYRKEHIDSKTAERSRRQANGTWTEEDEQAYLALDAEVTAWIEQNLPYPVGSE